MADEIEVGVVLRGATPKGAEQIRKVLSLHHNTTFGDQRDEDMCDYLVVAGHNVRSEEHTSELPVTLESRMPSSA